MPQGIKQATVPQEERVKQYFLFTWFTSQVPDSLGRTCTVKLLFAPFY